MLLVTDELNASIVKGTLSNLLAVRGNIFDQSKFSLQHISWSMTVLLLHGELKQGSGRCL